MKLSPQEILAKKNKKKITALTAYDFPTARILDEAGVDILMVGDSLGMVLLGHQDTRGVHLDDIGYHTVPVAKAAKRALVVADMPYDSFRDSQESVKNAQKLLQEYGADAIKIEGGVAIKLQVEALIRQKIPVMGHVGMLPQNVRNGKFRIYGKTEEEAEAILKDAKFLDDAGVFAIVLECIPSGLAERITKTVRCPTIGIGAGASTDGQILVLHDMLGIRTAVSPRFVRRYADLEKIIFRAVKKYNQDVEQKRFPSKKESF